MNDGLFPTPKPTKVPPLYDVPLAAIVDVCKQEDCGARITFVRSPRTVTKFIPLSLDSVHAQKNEHVRVCRAPSHYTDCKNPGRFTKR